MSDLVTIATYTYSHEARLAKTFLENAGMEPYLSDDHLVDVMPFYSNTIGGVKLRVWAEDEEEARALLAEIPPEAVRPFQTGWMAMVALFLGPLAFVILPIAWIVNGMNRSDEVDSPEA